MAKEMNGSYHGRGVMKEIVPTNIPHGVEESEDKKESPTPPSRSSVFLIPVTVFFSRCIRSAVFIETHFQILLIPNCFSVIHFLKSLYFAW